ncbi:hypothetical protein Hs20B_06120 [Lactococcus insecticola]|uniref:Uncharacterized protein n=1 Tax=Pseudolactococcus insecticola TaxID=2709158 RepID=A0A6A0B7C0_9LACT|nr:hypothetical protein Hs20B_06120 [Lactococcus insecticola]
MLIVSFWLNWHVGMQGYENILESIIQFSGLVIGFYTAMYGLVFIADSKLLKTFRDNDLDKIFQSNLIQSLSFSFMAYVVSLIMQALRFNSSIVLRLNSLHFFVKWNELGFWIWIFVVGVFVGMSYRTIRLLLKMLFYTENKAKRLPSTSDFENDQEKSERLSKIERSK